jgi:hypothetical protein
MALPYRDRPLKELKTARDWLYAVYDFAYECGLSSIEAIEKAIKSDIKPRVPSSYWKLQHLEDWIAWEDWIDNARHELARSQKSESSIRSILYPPTGSALTRSGSFQHKLLFCKSIVRNPPEFLKRLILNDQELCALMEIEPIETENNFPVRVKDAKYPYKFEGEEIIFYGEPVKLTGQGKAILECFESHPNGIEQDILIRKCCEADSPLSALHTAMNSFRKRFIDAFSKSTCPNKPMGQLDSLNIVPKALNGKYFCHLVKEG